MTRFVRRVVPTAVRLRIERWLWRSLNLHHELPSGLSLGIRGRSDWIVYNDIFVDREYERPVTAALDRWDGTSPLRVLDLGANVGFFTLYFCDRFLRREGGADRLHVRMVEGSPQVFARLRQHIGMQSQLSECVDLRCGLVGERDGKGRIRQCDFHGMNSLFRGPSGAAVDVPYVDLNESCRDMPQINLLKCDIEGSEQRLLETHGGLFDRVRVAVFEFHDELIDKPRCRELLAAHGLRTQHVLRCGDQISVEMFLRV